MKQALYIWHILMFSNIFEFIQNILFTFFDIFGLTLCYFWSQNCFKTSFLALWTILVNSCWPYLCDMSKYNLRDCKYLSQVPSPQIPPSELMQNSSLGGRKNHFFRLAYVLGITNFKSRNSINDNYLKSKEYKFILYLEKMWYCAKDVFPGKCSQDVQP